MKEFRLDKEPKIEPGFKIPDHYFEDFTAKVSQRLPEQAPLVISIFASKRIWIYASAAVLVITLMIPVANTFKSSASKPDSETLENYIADHANMSTDDLAEFLEVEDIQKIQIDSHLEDKAVEDLLSTNSNLEEYLLN